METRANRWLRIPLVYLAGLCAVAVVGWRLQPGYLDFCNRVNVTPCRPITTARLIGYLTVGLGLAVMLFGPIVWSLYELRKKGYNWETSRMETIVSNLPIALGMTYMLIGIGIAALG